MGFWQFMYRKPDKNPHVNAAELEYIQQTTAADAAVQAASATPRTPPRCPSWPA
jgi:ACS family hexuronate transporter-like MFS transporter